MALKYFVKKSLEGIKEKDLNLGICFISKYWTFCDWILLNLRTAGNSAGEIWKNCGEVGLSLRKILLEGKICGIRKHLLWLKRRIVSSIRFQQCVCNLKYCKKWIKFFFFSNFVIINSFLFLTFVKWELYFQNHYKGRNCFVRLKCFGSFRSRWVWIRLKLVRWKLETTR